MKRGLMVNILLALVAIVFLASYSFAAGGGGGGSSSSGLGFGSRDSVYIVANQDYSEKFSLKNGTKYDLKISVGENVSVSFGQMHFSLKEGDNLIDLNENGFSDINFNLGSRKGKMANIRIINDRDANGMPSMVAKPLESADTAVKTEEQEGDFKCADIETMRARVSCRLSLGEEEQKEELELYYLPEECRALTGSSRGLCIARYKSVQACWKFPVGEERVSCVKRSMRLGVIAEEKEACNKLSGENRSVCVRELKNKAYSLIKWHFYDLEERAEDFMHRGLIDRNAAADFIEKTELNKASFNEAGTDEEKKEIILAVREDWKEFTGMIKDDLKG